MVLYLFLGFLGSKYDFAPVFLFLLSFLPWSDTASGSAELTGTTPNFLWQSFAISGQDPPGVRVIFKELHFDVVHSITNSNHSLSGNNVLLAFTNT